MVQGVDVSYAQGTINWSTVAASKNVSFAYAKATEGLSVDDDQFAANFAGLSKNGIPHGAYHFFHFNSSPAAQAQHFLKIAKPEAGQLLPMVDVEVDDGVSDVGQKVILLSQFITAVEKAIGGKRMVIYSSYGFWNGSMNGSDAFSGHPFWLAEYNSDPQPTLPNGWKSWIIWQYSDSGSVPGISGNVDMDRLNGTSLKSLYI